MSEQNYRKELNFIIDALAESVFDSTDHEIMEEIRQSGRDPDVIANETSELFLNSVRRYKKRIFSKMKEKKEGKYNDQK